MLSPLNDFLVVDQKEEKTMKMAVPQFCARYSMSHFVGII